MAGAFPPNPQNASYASISHSTVAKDAAERELKLWSEGCGAIFFIFREGRAVSSALSVATPSNNFLKVAEPTTKMLSMLLTLSNIDALAFGAAVPEGWAQCPRHPAKYFDVFIKALAIVMTHGTESASEISTTRRRGLLEEMRAVEGRLEKFTNHHAAKLDPHKADVEKCVSDTINADLKDVLGALRDDAEALRQRHAFLAPARGSGQPQKTPRFEQLSCLVDRNHAHNLIGRLYNGLVAPQPKIVGRTGESKRESVDSDDTAAPARPRNQAASAPSASSAFIQSMTEWRTPAGVCASSWRGQKCERI